MNKDTASSLMKALAELNVAMNNVAAQIEEVGTEKQKLLLRKGIANLIGLAYTDLMQPVIQEYPDLDPDK